MPGQTNFAGYINRFTCQARSQMAQEASGTPSTMAWHTTSPLTRGRVLDIHMLVSRLMRSMALKENMLDPSSSYIDAQLNWLEADLKDVNRQKTPWAIAGAFYRS